jgi:hypothetical protein
MPLAERENQSQSPRGLWRTSPKSLDSTHLARDHRDSDWGSSEVPKTGLETVPIPFSALYDVSYLFVNTLLLSLRLLDVGGILCLSLKQHIPGIKEGTPGNKG